MQPPATRSLGAEGRAASSTAGLAPCSAAASRCSQKTAHGLCPEGATRPAQVTSEDVRQPRARELRAAEPLLLRVPGLYSTAHRSPRPAQLRTQARRAPWAPRGRVPMGLGLQPRRPGVVSDDNLRKKNHRPIAQPRGPSPGASLGHVARPALVAPGNQTNKTELPSQPGI